MITMLLMIVIFYFLLIRPQRKRQRELQDQVSAMKTGDRVVTIGGIHGLVAMIKDRTVVLKVADNTRIEFEKTGIASVLKKDNQKTDEEVEEIDADVEIRK
jgi:preprotein translocase subunit YajC